MPHGKKYRDAAKRFDRDREHTSTEALDLVKSLSSASFDETVELVVRLGVDPRKADQMVRGTVALPAGTGKDVRIAVFAQGGGRHGREGGRCRPRGRRGPRRAGRGRQHGLRPCDRNPDMMPLVGKLGRVLGPRGLMPNPKTGTVTPDAAKAVGEFKGGKVEYRTDRHANVHVPIGKVSFESSALAANYDAVIDELVRVKPSGAKGRYIRKVTLSSTMGPGVRVDSSAVGTG
ncbi:MAG: 50S ribosomal protein L1 [Microthrixaceae bacterium]|nr:50S ribosomal protein L1 [Microthrixaceae bacterium]